MSHKWNLFLHRTEFILHKWNLFHTSRVYFNRQHNLFHTRVTRFCMRLSPYKWNLFLKVTKLISLRWKLFHQIRKQMKYFFHKNLSRLTLVHERLSNFLCLFLGRGRLRFQLIRFDYRFRKSPLYGDSPLFGVTTAVDSEGMIKVGDPVYVLR